MLFLLGVDWSFRSLLCDALRSGLGCLLGIFVVDMVWFLFVLMVLWSYVGGLVLVLGCLFKKNEFKFIK